MYHTLILSFILSLTVFVTTANAESRRGITSQQSNKIVDTFTDISPENREKMKGVINRTLENPSVGKMIDDPFSQERDTLYTPKYKSNYQTDAQSEYQSKMETLDRVHKRKSKKIRQYKPIGKYWEE